MFFVICFCDGELKIQRTMSSSLMTNAVELTVVIINYRTPDLVQRAAHSFRSKYPHLPLVLIDNGSRDESLSVLHHLREENPDHTFLILNDVNLHHGPAMDQALQSLQSSKVLFLDSDCQIIHDGLIQKMSALLDQNPSHYIIGKRIFMNKRGFDVSSGPHAAPYIRPMCMMVKRELYIKLPKFQHHGTPCLANMREAVRQALVLLDFPVEEYVRHEGRGTANRFGYQLGWKGKLNFLLNKIGL